MPYKVLREGDKWVVHKMEGEEPGKAMGEHDSEEEAMAQMRALYANEKKSWAVKFAPEGDTWIEGLGMPFGGPFNGQDLDGEHFSAKTDFAFDWFIERPLLYHHGLDKDAGIAVVGRVKSWETKADLGIWTKAQLDASSEYFDAIKELVKQGKLFFSSGAMRHLVKVEKKTGEIARWPWVEESLTPTPSNLFAEVQTAEKHFELAGLKSAWDTKADLTTEQRKKLTEEDFAYVDSDGGRHLPMHDAAHARNALARFEQTEFESEEAKQKARKKLIAKAKELGIDVSEQKAMTEDAMRKMIRSMADKMNVQVTDKDMATMMDDMSDMMDEPLNKVMAAIADHLRTADNHKATNIDDLVASLKDMPLVTHTELISDMAVSLLERTKDLQERRTKEGRMISSANRKRLMQCMENMRGAMDEMESLMSASEPQAKASATIWRLRLGELALNAP